MENCTCRLENKDSSSIPYLFFRTKIVFNLLWRGPGSTFTENSRKNFPDAKTWQVNENNNLSDGFYCYSCFHVPLRYFKKFVLWELIPVACLPLVCVSDKKATNSDWFGDSLQSKSRILPNTSVFYLILSEVYLVEWHQLGDVLLSAINYAILVFAKVKDQCQQRKFLRLQYNENATEKYHLFNYWKISLNKKNLVSKTYDFRAMTFKHRNL